MKKVYLPLLLLSCLFFSSCDYFAKSIFFIATSFTSSPVNVNAPESKGYELPQSLPLLTADHTTITVILLGPDKMYCYEGEEIGSGKIYSYSGNNSVRSYLREKKSQFGKKLQVYIKTGENPSYKNTVDMLDEMLINNIKKYSLVEVLAEERSLIKRLK